MQSIPKAKMGNQTETVEERGKDMDTKVEALRMYHENFVDKTGDKKPLTTQDNKVMEEITEPIRNYEILREREEK